MAKRDPSSFFVYVITSGETPLYVGKGCGNRHKVSARKFGGQPRILEMCGTDQEAFDREKHWIAELRPSENKTAGGNGNTSRPPCKYDLPKSLIGIVSKRDWRAAVRADERVYQEIKRVGSQVYCARSLVSRLDEGNCERFGVSKVDLSRLREVAHG